MHAAPNGLISKAPYTRTYVDVCIYVHTYAHMYACMYDSNIASISCDTQMMIYDVHTSMIRTMIFVSMEDHAPKMKIGIDGMNGKT